MTEHEEATRTGPAFAVLVVDDEPDQRALLKAQLERLGAARLTVETASDGDDALAKLKNAPCDLMFLDYRLPPTNGLDVLDKVRQHHPKTAVVITSAAGNEQVAVAAMKKGAIDYLTQKDLRQADLAQLVRRVVELRDLVNQNMELRQVNQMKNEFIANVSHELRTPLTIVIGYANTMRDGSLGPLAEAQQKALNAIIERAEDLLGTLNNILRIREVREGRQHMLLKPVDLRRLVESRARGVDKEIRRKTLTLSLRLPPAEAWVMADEDKLDDVIDNLFSNAIKFSNNGGPLGVSVVIENRRAQVSVADQGPGVPPELLPRVFDAFSATGQGPTREHPGLGLGLPLSKHIIEALGGRIWIESAGAGRGTVARIELPLCAKEQEPTIVAGEEPLQKKRVLIVEDNPDLVEVLMLFLASVSHNLSIATARSGFDALEKLKEEKPNLLILDVMMPGMDGFEVLARLKRLPAEQRPPVMVLTGYSDALRRAHDAGAQEVLLKPIEKNIFIKKVLQLLQAAPIS